MWAGFQYKKKYRISIYEVNSIYNINEEENEEEEDLTQILSSNLDDNVSRTDSVY